MNEEAKRAAGEAAAVLVRDGMTVGLGSGTTASYFQEALAARIRAESLNVQGIAPSRKSEEHAQALGIPITSLERGVIVDLAVDGADEVDVNLDLIKGGGGALVREKLVVSMAREFVVIADASKSVETLGAFPLSVAIIPFGWGTTQARLEETFGVPAPMRGGPESPGITDDGLYVLDMRFGHIDEPGDLLGRLRSVVGVADAGLFVGVTSRVLFGNPDGTVWEVRR
jgi:ribose 5-phosphate isomerase A